MPPADPVAEAERLMVICNACRYCEGHCAVFPAMELRSAFLDRDLRYLANLCHGCGSCYHNCQYAPPHEFAVNVPRALAQVRAESYRRYAWPDFLSGLFEGNATAAAATAAAGLVAAGLLAIGLGRPALLAASRGPGSFYGVIPHGAMVGVFGAAGLYVLAALAVGLRRFWRDAGEGELRSLRPRELGRALVDTLRLRYLGGGGGGCGYPQEKPSEARRWFHHLTFYGFLLCIASTCAAALYHRAGLLAPYAWSTAPVVLGTLGGLGLVAGPVGLLALKARSDPAPQDPGQRGMDLALLALLLLTSATGFALLLLRATAAMGTLLVVHLGLVLGLFLTLPYGKFVHALYRFAALVRYARERSRRPQREAGAGG